MYCPSHISRPDPKYNSTLPVLASRVYQVNLVRVDHTRTLLTWLVVHDRRVRTARRYRVERKTYVMSLLSSELLSLNKNTIN